MKGMVVLPIFKSEVDKNGQPVLDEKGKLVFNQSSQLPYTCTLSKDPQAGSLGVEFSIVPSDEIKMDIWMAQLHLAGNNKISITYNNQGFTAGAELSGNLDIVTKYFNITAAKFQGLKLQTKPQYFALESLTMGLSSPQKAMADFPLTLDEATPQLIDKDKGL